MKTTAVSTSLAASLLLLSACSDATPSAFDAEDDYPSGPVSMYAGAGPGSGFDATLRSVVESLEKEGIVDVELPVENVEGEVGGTLLAQMIEEHEGADDQVAVTSLAMMANELTGLSDYGYDDVTMLARVMTEYFVVVAAPDSGFTDLDEAMQAVIAGEATVGAATDDEVPFSLLVAAAGGDPAEVTYALHEGGAEQSEALLDGTIDVAIAGVSEVIEQVDAGELDALGVLSADRLPGLDAPTAAEQGLDVTLANWRGLYGPPDMPAYAVEYWQDALAEMVESATWKDIAERDQFTTTFMVGDELDDYLEQTQDDVRTALEETGRL